MRHLLYLCLATQFLRASCQPYTQSSISFPSQATNIANLIEGPHIDEIKNVVEIRDNSERAWIQARDTTESSESTTSTSETTAESTTTTSELSTSTSESTTTSSETSSTSTSTSSTTTSTSTSASSTTTTSSSTTTTTTTSTATSTSSAELAAWNRAGTNRAIVFGCCLVALFAGVITLHCALDRAKAKRIAAREQLAASSVSQERLVTSKGSDSVPDRSSAMFRDSPLSGSRPHTPGMPPSPPRMLSSQAPADASAGGTDTTVHADRQRESPV